MARPQSSKGEEQNEGYGVEPHPLERFSGFGGGAHLRGHPADPSARRRCVGLHRRVGHHHPLEDGHVPPFPHRHYRDLRQASKRSRLAWPGRLSPVDRLLVAPVGIRLRRNLHRAAAGDHGAEVCGWHPGHLLWAYRRDRPGRPPGDLWPPEYPVSARRPGVWHRDAARPRPAALAGRASRRRGLVDPRGRAAPARHPAVRGDPGGVSYCLAGLRALVRTASASLGPRTWRGKPPAPLKAAVALLLLLFTGVRGSSVLRSWLRVRLMASCL